MIILSISNSVHDGSAVVADDYEILSAVQTERLTRIKCDGRRAHSPTIHEALRIANVDLRDVDAFLFYADILRRFKERTSLPVLVNTSFNAHEEPIVYTPRECLSAMRERRVDYVAGTNGLWQLK